MTLVSCTLFEESIRSNNNSKLLGLERVDIIQPQQKSNWRRGLPAVIEWKCMQEDEKRYRITLCQVGVKANTLVAENVSSRQGQFIYPKVPWGMSISSGYYIRITDQDGCWTDTTTFSIIQ